MTETISIILISITIAGFIYIAAYMIILGSRNSYFNTPEYQEKRKKFLKEQNNLAIQEEIDYYMTEIEKLKKELI